MELGGRRQLHSRIAELGGRGVEEGCKQKNGRTSAKLRPRPSQGRMKTFTKKQNNGMKTIGEQSGEKTKHFAEQMHVINRPFTFSQHVHEAPPFEQLSTTLS